MTSSRNPPLSRLQETILQLALENLLDKQEWSESIKLDENPGCDLFLHEVKVAYYRFPVRSRSKYRRRATGHHFRQSSVGNRYKFESTNAMNSVNRLIRRGLLVQVQIRPNAAYRLTYDGLVRALALKKKKMLADLELEWEAWRRGEREDRPKSFVHLTLVPVKPDDPENEE